MKIKNITSHRFVIDINENITTLHYLATTSKVLRSAVWQPLYHEPNGARVVTQQPDNIGRDYYRFTGTIQTRERDDSLIILPNVGLEDTMRINGDTRKILRQMSQYKHHVLNSTWRI